MQTHIVAKTIVFNPAGKLLFLRRSHDDVHRPGGFDFPGGQIDDAEAITTGAAREVAEVLLKSRGTWNSMIDKARA